MIPAARVARRNDRRRRLRAALLLGSLTISAVAAHPVAADASSAPDRSTEPTVVLVHGAWADASSWAHVVRRLQADGYTVLAPPTPLRSLAGVIVDENDVLRDEGEAYARRLIEAGVRTTLILRKALHGL